MSRVLQRLDDYRPLLAAVTSSEALPYLRASLRGTELVDCTVDGCHRAVIVSGPQDVETMLELADDEGWALMDNQWRCPAHHPEAHGHR